MRLLFTVSGFPPSKYGGIAASIYSVVKALDSTSFYEIKVLTTNFKIPDNGEVVFNKWTEHHNIPVQYVKNKFSFISLRYLFEGFHQILIADQIHLSGTFFYPTIVFVFFSKLFGKTIILSPHGDLLKGALKFKSWKKRPYLMLLRIIHPKIIFRPTSEDEATQIRHLFPNATSFIIPNFFTLPLPLQRKRLNQFVFLGRISKIKKIENLVLACSLSKHFISANYTIVFAGPFDNEFLAYETKLRELIALNKLEQHIHFCGEVNSPEKEELLAESKALFLVSDSENFGNVIVEALAQGTPVVASKGTPWQGLNKYNCGYWIDNSPESIAAKMDEIISMDEECYKTMSDNCLNFSKEFSKENVLPKWIELINHAYSIQRS